MFNQYPYLNLNDLNLDYILRAIKEMRYEVTNFVSINAIKYADPIQWNITSQYEKNTIVIDPVTGTAYISVAPVPAGVALTRPEYWTVVFDLGSFVTRAAQNFTSRWESDTTLTATFATPAGAWLVWGDVLYKALVNITAGDTYVVNSNIEHFTIEDLYNAYLNTIASILALIGDLTDLDTADKTNIVSAINEVVANIGDLSTLTTTDKTSAVNAINEVVVDLAQETTDRINKPYINVKDFGAVGDGVVDDYNAFIDAMTFAGDGGAVIIPNGIYNLSANPDDLGYTTKWLIDSDVKFIGAGAGDPNYPTFDGDFQSPLTNHGNICVGDKAVFRMTPDNPSANGVTAYSKEWIAGNNASDFIDVSASLNNGSSVMQLNSAAGVTIGDGVIPVNAIAGFPDGSTRANTMRVVSVDLPNNTITIGPDATNGAGGAVATPWAGASFSNQPFKIRHRQWDVINFVGVATGTVPNVDRFMYCENLVMDVEQNAGIMVEMDANFRNPTTDLFRALYISGQGNYTIASRAIDIERGDTTNWSEGIRLRNCDKAININANRPITIETQFYNNYTQSSQPIAYGIRFDNISSAIDNVLPLFAGAQIMDGANCIELQRATDTSPNGSFIAGINAAANDEVFYIRATGDAKFEKIYAGSTIALDSSNGVGTFNGGINVNNTVSIDGATGIGFFQGLRINQVMTADTSATVAGYVYMLDGNGNTIKVMIAS